MSINVGGKAVPIIWRPADLQGPDSDGMVGRGGQVIRAIVHHRIVGTIETTVNSTFAPTFDNELDPGERRVASHFGIGFVGSEVRIYQFVALENTAYCNGQTASDRADCTWSTWVKAGKPDANRMTVSIEHEDNAKAGDYIVREEIIQASMALDKLLLSGDGPAIRKAGIHCSDGAALQLRKITPSRATLVDHKTVCPISKPYCWRPIGKDKGFPQDRYVAFMAGSAPQEEPMGLNVRLAATAGTDPLASFGTAKIKGANHSIIRVADKVRSAVPDGMDLGVVQVGTLDPPLDTASGDRTNVVAFTHLGKMHVALRVDVAFVPLPAPGGADCEIEVGEERAKWEAWIAQRPQGGG